MTDLRFWIFKIGKLISILISTLWVCFVSWGIIYDIPHLQQQQMRDSLTIVSLRDSLFHQTARIDTVYVILNDEILPELKLNASLVGSVDSLKDYTQVLNKRTAPLLHYQE